MIKILFYSLILLLILFIFYLLVSSKCDSESEISDLKQNLSFEFEGKYYSVYEIMCLKGHKGEIYTMDLSPDGKIIASSGSDKKIIFWSTESGKILQELVGHQEKINSIAFDINGSLLASGSEDQSIKIWSVKTGRLINSIVKYVGPIKDVCFSPKGSFIAAAYGEEVVRLWSLHDFKLVTEIKPIEGKQKTGDINSIKFSLDGQNIIAAGNDIYIFSWKSGKVLNWIYNGYGENFSSVTYDKNYTFLVAGGSIMGSFFKDTPMYVIWSFNNKEHLIPKNTLFDPKYQKINSVSIRPDGKYFISGNTDDKIHFYSMQTGKKFFEIDAHSDDINSVKFLPYMQGFISASSDSTIKIWKIIEEGQISPDHEVILVDNNPPKIFIEKPNLTRGMKLKSIQKSYRIEGHCEDESGINEITINGQSIPFSDTGKFWTDFSLKLGENLVIVSATDLKGNSSQLSLKILRESDYKELPKETIVSLQKEMRLALVIGNSDYQYGGKLSKPVNDSKAIGAALKNLNFTVMRYENLDRVNFLKAIDNFGDRLKDFDVGLFFYAGHGIQAKGHNFLIPIDANLKSENDIEYNCVQTGRLLSKMEDSGTRTNIIILDACRDNPFERSWIRGISGKGLVSMNAPSGSFIAYATSPGKTALDGSGVNGLYTSALLEHISIPAITIEKVFKQVRTTVETISNGQQTPWESTSLKGDFYFNP